jgi:glycosyltransferase involved in cell wall biosynthesis
VKIVVVSCHYPPNFVSGGTLVPQRVARELRARGHDVHVYAGWLDFEGTRTPLETWTDTDETGLPVRWIVTTPFIGWSDDRNWRNPPVTADFAAWLETLRPDVVHLHCLQSLGGDLVTAAADHGARVIVTMHDFWWICARQFLVDLDFRPCSLVVAAGGCQCEVGADRRAERARALREVLEQADRVLAPSVSALAVLAANGVASDRLMVDENGLPERAAFAARARDGNARRQGSVRFTYAGGSERMKGVHVLLAAARRLAREHPGGWKLTAYGAERFVTEDSFSMDGLPVEVRSSFSPAELDDVLGATDVLVLPSVMRETHSILTREALVRGVPVLASDSIGPEEVLVDGENGLIVPSADPDALAGGMRRFLDEPSLRDRLASGCRARPPAIRPLDAQVEGLERLYRDLLAGPPPSHAPVPRIRRVGFMVGIESSPLRYRARLPAEALGLVGVETEVRYYVDELLPAMVDRSDVLVVYRVPATVQVLDVIERARRRSIPVIYDVDDLIFDPELEAEIPALRIIPREEYALWMEGVRRYRTTMEACDGYIGSTPMLVRHAMEVTGLPTAQFDNGIGLLFARRADAALRRPRAPGPLRIGYVSGTTTHDEDWAYVEPAILRILAAHPSVELWLVGHLPLTPACEALGSRLRRVPAVPWYEVPDLLRDLDVNLAPLTPGSRFNEAKSAIKWLEAALTETCTIASPTEPFRDAIVDGVNGLLARTEDEWFAAIDGLLRDSLRRRRMGSRARRDGLLRWSPHLQAHRYLSLLETARSWSGKRAQRLANRPPWEPVIHDDPLRPHALEPYVIPDPAEAAPASPPPPPAPSPTVGATVRYIASRVRDVLRDEGLGSVVRRSGPWFALWARQARDRLHG